MSSSSKRTHSLDRDGVDDNDDRNFKHIWTKEPAVADGPPIKGDLLSSNQTLNVIEDVQIMTWDIKGFSFVKNMAQSFPNATWGKLCEKLLIQSLDDVLTMEDEVNHAL
ncbi:hypothetical protein LIER_20788 [Lithospermum erythrorhizon]|uniref:Uncharacterized protein n=1 Tax=Lithospermum erythrorhizon TaxID=34254 RepID=A0AAV3QP73_LITER